MEASTRLLRGSTTHHLLLLRRYPSFRSLKLPFYPRHFSVPSSKPIKSSSVLLSSSTHRIDRQHLDLGLGFGGRKAAAASCTVVLLGWLGAEENNLKRYAELYAVAGARTVRFVVLPGETLGFDLGRNVEGRIEKLAAWIEEGERGEKERHLIFHTFSNTGWLVVLKAVEPVTMGTGVVPAAIDGVGDEGEMMYMRARFERVVGSKDSEAFYMLNPDVMRLEFREM